MAHKLNHEVVIIGGGSAGIATAASMLKRRPSLDIAIVEPSEDHYYQPGWTMVGGGIFEAPATHRTMASVMPEHATWLRSEEHTSELKSLMRISYAVFCLKKKIKTQSNRYAV